MAKVKVKRGSGVPSGLTAWELAYDFTNGNFYIGNTAGTPVLIGVSGAVPSNVVTSFNGLTGAVGGVCAASANTFTALQSFSSGISANGATFSSYLSALNFKATAVGGDEGGQIDFGLPAGSSLSGTVAIDLYQNKVRIFETSGTNRGVYIDLSGVSAGVGTNLIGAGGGGGGVSSVTGTGAGISISPTTGAVIVENTGVKSLTNSNSLTLSGSTGAISIGINSTSITTAKVYNDTSITLNVDDGIGGTNNVVVYPSATTFSRGISLAAFSYFTAGLCAAGSTFSGSQNFVNGATFSGIVNLRSGLCASGGTFSGTQTFVNGATFSALANFTSGLCASGGISFSGQLTGVSATFSGLIISSAGFSGTGITLSGNLSAATKSFVIPHPTKKNMTLRYGSLEGPENGVYVRGKLQGMDTINLPDYWSKLIDKDSITVNLTPIKSPDIHFIKTITKSKVTIGSSSGEINCFYTVYAERKDVPKLTVEY